MITVINDIRSTNEFRKFSDARRFIGVGIVRVKCFGCIFHQKIAKILILFKLLKIITFIPTVTAGDYLVSGTTFMGPVRINNFISTYCFHHPGRILRQLRV